MGGVYALPFFVLLLWYRGIPDIHPNFWKWLFVPLPFSLLANILTIEAHQASHMTTTTPYLAVSAPMLLVTAPLLGGPSPTIWGVIGVITIVAGIYILSATEGGNPKQVFRYIKTERGPRLMLIVGVLYGFMANVDYWGIKYSSLPFWIFSYRLAMIAGSALLVFGYRAVGRIKKGELRPPLLAQKGIWLSSIFGILSIMPHLFAIKLLGEVPYVIAGKRAGTVIGSTAAGITLALVRPKEHSGEIKHLGKRFVGIATILIGMTVFYLLGK